MTELQPQTIPQYRQFTKALQLKLAKQRKQLQANNFQIRNLMNQISLAQMDLDKNNKAGKKMVKREEVKDLETMQGKCALLGKFRDAACAFGMSPEAVYRIADFACKNEVEADYFRVVLSKIELGLSPKEVSNLIYILDENCTGFIYRDEFNYTLFAFKASVEESYLPFTSACVEKLAKIMEMDKVSPLAFYKDMQAKANNDVRIDRFYQKVKMAFGSKMLIREIVGAFNGIDLEGDQIVCERNFIYSINSALNKMIAQSNVKKIDQPSNTQSQFQTSNLSILKKSNIVNKNMDSVNNDVSTLSLKVPKIDEPQQLTSSTTLQKLQTLHKVTLQSIYSQICQNPLINRLTLFQFKRILASLKTETQIQPSLSSLLFRQIDAQQKGTVHFAQLILFYLQNGNDMAIIFQLLGVYFANNDLDSEKFWFVNGVGIDADLSKGKFVEIMEKTFGASENWNKLWEYFDKGRGVVPVASIVKQLKKYETTS